MPTKPGVLSVCNISSVTLPLFFGMNLEKRLFCARDRFGLRRLYSAQVGDRLIFCNSLDCLRQHPSITSTLNQQAIADFLLFGTHTWLDKSITIYQDIQRLPPAHFLIWQEGKITIQRYWDIPRSVPLLRYRNQQDYLEHFRAHLYHRRQRPTPNRQSRHLNERWHGFNQHCRNRFPISLPAVRAASNKSLNGRL